MVGYHLGSKRFGGRIALGRCQLARFDFEQVAIFHEIFCLGAIPSAELMPLFSPTDWARTGDAQMATAAAAATRIFMLDAPWVRDRRGGPFRVRLVNQKLPA